ncbi:beta-L-arabinofuranosidase domain-containing protein [Agreia sp. Leaf244]|uniref:beta-L-arabinofuranosidase domain-containing protein n=1 Tax=Agreia sp. Leaf244 TaxID=1736305 RepID=UPI00138F28AA|nr:beta-L-arabinofuranosidase domain-containing protein [Agreia sp. Leaf244]
MWTDVGPDSAWLGGNGESWERGPYYLDGLVPLAYILDDPRLIARARPWIEWILDSQDSSGFFGPATNRDWWPRTVALKAITQYADATGDERVPAFVDAYLRYQLAHLPTEPLTDWACARGADNVLSVLWLHARTGESWLLDLSALLLKQTADWDTYLGEQLISGPAREFHHLTHGTNVAMGLKTGAVASAVDGCDRREATERSFAALDRWHGQVHGFFSGDEWLGGREATAGLETCQVVELMFTLENCAQIYGGGVYGDRLESLAFNLLAAACNPEMTAHQYHQQANQVLVSVASRPWTHSSDDANIFGLEPHFGCCTANLHQGWPKLVRSLWVQDPDGGLRVIAYAPAVIDANAGGKDIRLEVDTEYPFDEVISIRVRTEREFDRAIRLRIPAWADTSTLTVDGEAVDLRGLLDDGYVSIERTWRDGSLIRLLLPMRPRVIERDRGAIGLRFGPLQLALRVPENWIPVAGAPGLGEWEVRPRTSWNFAIDSVDAAPDWAVIRRAPGPVPFSLADAPLRFDVRGAHTPSWTLDGAQAGRVPDSPVIDAGPPVDVALVPYGSARIRVSEFPVRGKFSSPVPFRTV